MTQMKELTYNNRVLRVIQSGVLLIILSLCTVFNSPAIGALFTEPSTVIYGKIMGVGSKWPFLITEGQLDWSLKSDSGKVYQFNTKLLPLADGQFSYRLNIPLKVLTNNDRVNEDNSTIPLSSKTTYYSHNQINVNGLPARITSSESNSVGFDELSRASTQRMDLYVDLVAPDSDGDGLPDHWEDEYGLDKQNASDAAGDLDLDGVKNLTEYLAGTNPDKSDEIPTIITSTIEAYSGVLSGVAIDVHDNDTSDDNITITFLKLPRNGDLFLRQFANEEQVGTRISLGDKLSLRSFNQGEVIYLSESTDVIKDSVTLSASDENLEHTPHTKDIEIVVAQKNESQTGNSFDSLDEIIGSGLIKESAGKIILGQDYNYMVWNLEGWVRDINLSSMTSDIKDLDSQEFIKFDSIEKPHLIVTGHGYDNISGGIKSDIIIGGNGSGEFRGGMGADSFVMASFGGEYIIQDFDVNEGDDLDLRLLMEDVQGRVDDHLSFRNEQNVGILEINQSNGGNDDQSLSVRFKGVQLTEEVIRDFIFSEVIKIPESLKILPRLRVETVSNSTENSQDPGLIRIHRDGRLDNEINFELNASGSAVNGVDYEFIPIGHKFEVGQEFVEIKVSPFVDSVIEPTEIVEFWIGSSDNYEISTENSSALVTIKDLVPELSIELVRDFDEDKDLPALVLVKRHKLISNSLFVKINYAGGLASKDLTNGPSFVSLIPGQSVELLEIKRGPKLDNLKEGAHLEISLATDSSYIVGVEGMLRMNYIGKSGFEAWVQKNFTDLSGDIEDLALEVPGNTGISLLNRYAFGLDPHNPESRRLPRISVDDQNYILIKVSKTNDQLDDVSFMIESSDDLESWGNAEELVLDLNQSESTEYIYRSKQVISNSRRKFFRLKVSLKNK